MSEIKTDSERISRLHRVSQLVGGRTRIQTQIHLIQKSNVPFMAETWQ
jgi:hypothetical protein